MRGLTPSQLLDLWDAGVRLHPIDRAVLLAAAATPQRAWDDVVDMAVGSRDAIVLRLRQATVGDRLAAAAQCPACGVSCELSMSVQALLEQVETPSPDNTPCVPEFRLPSSRDMAAAACARAEDAERVLVERCVAGNTPGAGCDERTIERLSEWIARHDPLAEVELTLHCEDCQHAWGDVLDPPALFWQEVNARARSLLDEVDRLARAYGWSEAEVLSLSDARRAAYLERTA